MDQETIDYVALCRLQRAYADAVSRRSWDDLHAQFRPDAVVELDLRNGQSMRFAGPGELGSFIGSSIERFEFFEFVILNTHLDIAPDGASARGRMWMLELRQEAYSGRWTNAYGLYQDDYVKVDGRWWFAHRQYHSLARRARDADVFEVPPTAF